MKHDIDDGARHTSDWSQWTVEHMWRVLWNEDPERTARHGGAWYNVMDACARHRDRLRAFRDQLLHRWSGPAADAYLAKLDQLIKGLDETTEAAFNTYRALSTMADAIATARQQMTPLYAQWQRYEQEERDARDQWWVVQAIRGTSVTPQEREALNRPARAIMNVASDAIFQSYLTMTPAPLYRFTSVIDPGVPIDQDRTNDALHPPQIAPLHPQRPTTSRPLPSSASGLPGPILGGNSTALGNPPIQTPSAGSPSNYVVPPSVLGVPPSGGILPWQTVSPRIGPLGASATIGPSNKIEPPSPNASTQPVIGTRPNTPGWAPVAPMGQRAGTRSANPVGGVLSAPAHANRFSVRSNHDRRSHEDDGGFAIDASDAVPAVLVPDPIPSFDHPGPAIGIDR
jgi:hypothetical protein